MQLLHRYAPFLILLLVSGCAPGQHAKFAAAERILTDPGSTEAAALESFYTLRNPSYASSVAFWRAVADDDRLLPIRRHRALILLFVHHVHVGMTLGDFAPIVAGSPWLKRPESVVVVDMLTGPLPFVMLPDTSIVAISPFLPPDDPTPAFFNLQVEGPYLSTANMLETINHPETSKFAQRKIMNWGIITNDPQDEGLVKNIRTTAQPPQPTRTLLDIELDKRVP